MVRVVITEGRRARQRGILQNALLVARKSHSFILAFLHKMEILALVEEYVMIAWEFFVVVVVVFIGRRKKFETCEWSCIIITLLPYRYFHHRTGIL